MPWSRPCIWSRATPSYSCCAARAPLRGRALSGGPGHQSLPFVTKGLAITLQVSASSSCSPAGRPVPGGGAHLRTAAAAPPRARYSDIIRGIPVLILIFAVYGLPALQGEPVEPDRRRGGAHHVHHGPGDRDHARRHQSIHHGQMEAAKAIGLGFGQRLLYVIFPQALRRFLPPGSTASPTRSRAVRWCRWSAWST